MTDQKSPLRDIAGPAEDTKIVSWTMARPQALHILCGFVGLSSAGKTVSGLRFARGLTGKRGKVFLADTEHKRALFNADWGAPWTHGDLTEPFTSERYVATIRSAEAAGADCLIIDSTSHEWEAEGGVLEQAELDTNNKGLGKWRLPKMRHKKFLRAIQRSRLHVICCLRAKDKYVQEGQGATAKIEKAGIVPVQDPRFVFDMTIQLLFDDPAKPGTAIVVKCPGPLWPAFGVTSQGQRTDRMVDEEMGRAVGDWCAGREKVDDRLEGLRSAGREAADKGTTALRDWWMALSREQQHDLADHKDNLKSVASEADRRKTEAELLEMDDERMAEHETDPFRAGAK